MKVFIGRIFYIMQSYHEANIGGTAMLLYISLYSKKIIGPIGLIGQERWIWVFLR